VKIAYPQSRLDIRYSRSGGPGGQNVNKVETKVEVRLHLRDLDVPPHVRDRIAARLGGRLDAEGRVTLASSRYRLRSHNLRDCLDRLDAMLEAAAKPPVPRIATKPTRGALQRRRDSKQRRSQKKRDRRRSPGDD
jgi:ribosome-associated protein